MPVPYLGLKESLRFDPPPETLYCECGIAFEHPSRDRVEQMHADHQAEMRDPAEHEAIPF